MLRGALGFLLAAFVELCQLLLVVVAPVVGMRVVSGAAHAAIGAQLGAIAMLAAFELVLLIPARDLVQGWLGLLAGRRPARFDDRAIDAGRGMAALVGSVVFAAASLAWIDRGRGSPEAKAFEFALPFVAVLVFGIGRAVPWLWFATRARPPVANAADSPLPALLRIASGRASRFVYCAFVGLGLALGAAQLAERPGTAAPVPLPAPLATPSAPLTPAELAAEPITAQDGELCRAPTPECPADVTIALVAVTDQPIAIDLGGDPDRKLPRCRAEPAAAWPADAAIRAALQAQLDDPARTEIMHVPARAGDRVALRLGLPTGAERCAYTLLVSQLGHAGLP